MASVEDDDENFAEDECTIDFGEEDPPAAPAASTGVVNGPRFIEYPGEDFSKYLSETTLTLVDHNNEDDQVDCG